MFDKLQSMWSGAMATWSESMTKCVHADGGGGGGGGAL